MKYLSLLIISIILSCSFPPSESVIENYFSGTNTVKTFGDSIRLEVQDSGIFKINHYMHLDSSGKITFLNNTVSSYHRIEALENDSLSYYQSIGIDKYEIRIPSKNLDETSLDSVYIDYLRKGQFHCYFDSIIQPNAYILETRIEGNGTYRNNLFLIIPNKEDTVQLYKLYDKWLTKSYSWDWKKVIPMSWVDYKIKKEENSKFSESFIKRTDSLLKNIETRRMP